LNQRRFEIFVTFGGLAGIVSARALVLSRCQPLCWLLPSS
jgi:hypothetical protein